MSDRQQALASGMRNDKKLHIGGLVPFGILPAQANEPLNE